MTPAVAVVDLPDLTPPPALYGVAQPWAAVLDAIAASPSLDGRDLALTVRTDGTPRVAVFGDLAPHEVDLLAGLPRHLADVWSRLRVVDDDAAGLAAEQLARRLRERLGPDLLDGCRFHAVPRGGLFVLGHLAYLLGLRPEQLPGAPPTPAQVPVVVVDDCAISGVRMQEIIGGLPDHEIVVALMYAHPDLQGALEAADPRVLACVVGDELADHAPSRLGADHADWQARWADRGHGLWSGLPDYLCLPWNEPDSVVWDDRQQRAIPTWRLVPPRLCLKNRALHGRPPSTSVHGATRGRLDLADGVVVAELEDAVLLGHAVTGGATRLDGVAAAMWRALATATDRGTAISALAATYDVDRDRIAADVQGLVDQLVDRDVLTSRPA